MPQGSADFGQGSPAPTNGTGPQTSWSPVDLTLVIDGKSPAEPPSHLRRGDGPALIYSGKQHSAYGEPESCKSLLAAHAAAGELRAGMNVVVVDFEDDARTWVERLLAMSVPHEQLRARLHYVRPEEPINGAGWEDLEPALASASLVVIDGTNEGMALHGFNLTDNAEAAQWMQILRRCQRQGAAVLAIDHVTKDRESRGRYAIGAQAKLAAVDVAYSLRVIKPFGRGREGLVAIKVEKDRPGYVREHQGPDGQIALMRLTSEADGSIRIALEPPEDAGAGFRPTFLMERISRAIEQQPGITKRGIRDTVAGKSSAKDLALELLVADGFVDRKPEGTAHAHYSERPFREASDVETVPPERAPRAPACPSRAPDVPGECAPVPPVSIDGARGTPPSELVPAFDEGEAL